MCAGLAIACLLPMPGRLWPQIGVTLFGGLLAAGGANAFNMYFERDVDALSPGTKSRPLVTGRLSPAAALLFGAVLVAVGTLAVTISAGARIAALVLLAVAVYAIVYTRWLKPKTPYYTLVGGLLWAAPIPILWIAAGRPLSAVPVLVLVIAACWTALHTWSVGLASVRDDVPPQIPYMPTAWGSHVTRWHVFGLAAVIAAAAVLLGVRALIPADVVLFALAALALVAGKSWSDSLLSRASIFYICALVVVLVAGKITGSESPSDAWRAFSFAP